MAANEIMAANEMMAPNVNANCQYSTRYCWEAEKVKSLIRLRAELSPLFTGKRNASKYAWAVVERELNVPLPLSKIIKKWNNLLQEYKAIKMSEEPKRREWPFFTLMDVYFSDQVNDPSLRLFSSTKTLKETIDDSVFEEDPIIVSAIAAATSGALLDIDELMRRQKERAIERKFSDFKYEMKPMAGKYNNDVGAKLSKSVDDLSRLQQQQQQHQQQQQQQHQQQQYKIKEELLRQHEQQQQEQENLAKINKHHARQQQQHQQHHHHQQAHHPHAQQPSPHRYHHQHSPPMQQATPVNVHRLQQPTPPPASLHAALQNQQHILHQHQHQHHIQHQHQQQQQHQQQHQQPQQPHQRQPTLHPTLPPQPPTPTTTAQQIHIQTAQHQAAQQQQQLQQSQNSQYADPNTIDQYLLSWNNFHGNMCRGFHTLQKDEKMVDVTIAAGGKIFKAHKLVLSVCSPYFQQIFLENPSSHPILLMADVEANHMAGLLDFMYSGQVNVKYEDLPLFLKVAEAMKIKGLHTEKNSDDESKDSSSTSTHDSGESTECRFDRGTHSVNITGQGYGGHASMLHHPQQIQAQQQQQQPPTPQQPTPQPENSLNGNGNNNNNNNNNTVSTNTTTTPIPVQTFSSFRDHIKSKATLAETFMKNLSRNNNNSSNNNFNHNGPEVSVPVNDNYASILQGGGNNNKKIFDSARKQHKYLAKRKILMHYNESQNEKRLKEIDQTATTATPFCETEREPEEATILSPTEKQQSSSFNFKIRLLENHQNKQNCDNNNTDNNNLNNDTANDHEEGEEEEALNLVQNSSINEYHKHKKGMRHREAATTATPTPTTTTVEPMITEEEIGGNPVMIKHEIFDDNNNTNPDQTPDTDSNNNNKNSSSLSNCKNAAALLNAMKRRSSKDAELENIAPENAAHDDEEEAEADDNDTDDMDRMVIDTDNNSDSNNNNHSQLDLSNPHHSVKKIATAEILCGLKSKVFKIEDDQQQQHQHQHQHHHQQQQQQQQQLHHHHHQHQQHRTGGGESCRNLSEIKNAE